MNRISIFGEELSVFRSARAYFIAMEKFEEEYMPFGKARETLGSIFYGLAKNSKLDRRIVGATTALNASRMGIYEVLETKGCIFRL